MNSVFFKSKLLISLAIIGTLLGILAVILAIYKSEYAMIPTLISAFIPLLFAHFYDFEEKKYDENNK